jgi:hypothetical protein
MTPESGSLWHEDYYYLFSFVIDCYEGYYNDKFNIMTMKFCSTCILVQLWYNICINGHDDLHQQKKMEQKESRYDSLQYNVIKSCMCYKL